MGTQNWELPSPLCGATRESSACRVLQQQHVQKDSEERKKKQCLGIWRVGNFSVQPCCVASGQCFEKMRRAASSCGLSTGTNMDSPFLSAEQRSLLLQNLTTLICVAKQELNISVDQFHHCPKRKMRRFCAACVMAQFLLTRSVSPAALPVQQAGHLSLKIAFLPPQDSSRK